jgi:hypothetical protein
MDAAARVRWVWACQGAGARGSSDIFERVGLSNPGEDV